MYGAVMYAYSTCTLLLLFKLHVSLKITFWSTRACVDLEEKEGSGTHPPLS